MSSQEHVYRNGRLVLPRDLVDRDPRAQAAWLASVPVADRARAFRALPLNVGAAAFLLMEPRARVGLLAGLNRQNIRYLVSIASEDLLLETLGCAGEDVHAAVFAELPEWRNQRIQELLEDRRRDAAQHGEASENPTTPAGHRGGLGRLLSWLRRV